MKFKTIIAGKQNTREPQLDIERLTRFGKLLRSTSLYEIPELMNILKGDMSLVGPRPLLMQYLDRYTAFTQTRHLDGWSKEGVRFVFGMDSVKGFVRRAEGLGEEAWEKRSAQSRGKEKEVEPKTSSRRCIIVLFYRKSEYLQNE